MIYHLSVYIETNLIALNRPFSYYSKEEIKKGTRVEVNFNNRNIIGFVLDVEKIDETNLNPKIKEINKIIDENPILNEEMINLAKDVSKYYFYPLIGVLNTFLPPSLKPVSSYKNNPKIAYEYFYKLNDDNYIPKNKNEEKLLIKFSNSSLILKNKINSSKTLENLINKKVIELIQKEKYRYLFYKKFKYESKIRLNKEQEEAYLNIINSDKKIHLLKGITGSGKTEVYIKLIEYYLNKGLKTIILVPEIALTPLMISRISSYFNNEIAILHSALTNAERYDEYRKIKDDKVDIVLGTRSAIFAPLNNLGLIIIDEEHDSSYKQEDKLPYQAKDIASLRLKYNPKLKIILGSATPSIEDMFKAKLGIYNLITLNYKFYNKEGIDVSIIDSNNKDNFSKSKIFSNQLIDELNLVFKNNKQAMILINQRGYSRFLYCESCHYIFKCPTCNLSLIYHKEDNSLRCHHCDYKIKAPISCPKCGNKTFLHAGIGIEQVEEEFNKLFPLINPLILNSDKTPTLDEIEDVLIKFNNRESNILLGTQIIAKGHDFKDVDFVAILNPETILNLGTYKAKEETFALLVQTLGRSGRKNKGKGLIQTIQKDDPTINFAINFDYDKFFENEILRRKENEYPPFTNLIKIAFDAKNKDDLTKYLKYFKERFEEYFLTSKILGPTYIFKNNIYYRAFIYIKEKDIKLIKDDLVYLIENFKYKNKLKISLNFSPFEL